MNAVTVMPQSQGRSLSAVDLRARKNKWQRDNRRAFKLANGYSTTANYGAGGNRNAVLTRDNFACVKCGVTDQQHKAKWSRPITIDHISKDRTDNGMANLQTLCLECHGRKDLIAPLRQKKAKPYVGKMRAMRDSGATYQAIADDLRLSVATVWKYLTGKSS